MGFFTYLFLAGLIIIVVLIGYFAIQSVKNSPIGVYHCFCDVPGYGEKEALVTIQVVGESWGIKVLYPTNISLNIFGYSVPCSCESV